MKLEVLTPSKILVQTDTNFVTLPGAMGEVGILEGHAHFITMLDSGIMSYEDGNEKKKLAIHFGVAEVFEDKISVLADYAEASDEINEESAKKELAEATTALSDSDGDNASFKDAAAKQKRAQTQLNLLKEK